METILTNSHLYPKGLELHQQDHVSPTLGESVFLSLSTHRVLAAQSLSKERIWPWCWNLMSRTPNFSTWHLFQSCLQRTSWSYSSPWTLKRKEEKRNQNDKCARKARLNPGGVAWARAGRNFHDLGAQDSNVQHISPTALYLMCSLVNGEIMNMPWRKTHGYQSLG